ncbi:MAG: hypothetical protein Q8N88_03950, partial [Nanoarchaeota archaeon]|nr:hypothetical protein [Nanoarchaeota archaeon]
MKNKRGEIRSCIIILNLIISVIAFSVIVGAFTPEEINLEPSDWKSSDSQPNIEDFSSSSPSPPASSLIPLTGVKGATGAAKGLVVKTGFMGEFTDATGNIKEVFVPANTPVSSEGAVLIKGEGYTLTQGMMQEYTKPSSTFSKILGVGGGSALDALATGVQWAGIAYMAGYLVGSLFGMSKQNTQALSTSLAAGVFVWKGLSVYKSANLGWFSTGAGSFITGVGVGAVVFLLMYKKTKTQTVTFSCLPWQAPVGGNDCEKCNDGTLPCSEYRCKSLGQNCEIVNQGTTQEKCVNVNPRDVNPPVISPNEKELSEGYKYTNVRTSPPGPGFNIVNSNSSDGCLQAFTPLQFGIELNEPAQCKIDFNHTTKFDDMVAFFGGSNLYSYNHSEQFALPGAKVLANSSLILENGKDLTFFIRCRDKNGNENSAEYAVNLCVDPSPDTTAPQIKATSVLSEGCVAEGVDSADVEFYINEPAICKWSFEDASYENMKNNMICSNELYQVNANFLFTCQANLSGIAMDGTKYYIRCEDQPNENINDRNRMSESFVFNLRGSTALKLKTLMPNGTIFGAVNPAPVELYTETLFGCNNGRSICYYSTTDNKNDYIMFYDTNNEDGISTQRQDLTSGKHKYYVQCIDAGGNVVSETLDFSLDIDTSAPNVARVYQENELLKVVTTRESECAYSFNNCDFSFEEGT